MKVCAFRPTQSFKVRGPAVRILHWLRLEMPSPEEALTLEYIRHPLSPSKSTTMGLLVLTGPRTAALNPDLFIQSGINLPVSEREKKTSYGSISAWPCGIDEVLSSAMARFWEDPTLPPTARPPWCT